MPSCVKLQAIEHRAFTCCEKRSPSLHPSSDLSLIKSCIRQCSAYATDAKVHARHGWWRRCMHEEARQSLDPRGEGAGVCGDAPISRSLHNSSPHAANATKNSTLSVMEGPHPSKDYVAEVMS